MRRTSKVGQKQVVTHLEIVTQGVNVETIVANLHTVMAEILMEGVTVAKQIEML